MQKIMFNDKYGLTGAVLEGRKTMTRRIIRNVIVTQDLNEIDEDGDMGRVDTRIIIDRFSRYKPGDVVAVAQPYKDVIYTGGLPHPLVGKPGWTNKMFVRADRMLHQIRITNVCVERLQDISEEDCLREGVYRKIDANKKTTRFFGFNGTPKIWLSPREAFAALIDKVSGKGTWQSNPWVYVYEFELVK